MRLYLIRHGQTTWNRERRIQGWSETPLSEAGQEQALRLAERLRGVPLTAVYSSTLERAVQTARPLADATGAELAFDDRLKEQGLGVLEGLTDVEIQERFPELWGEVQNSTRWVSFPHGEARETLLTRVAGLLADLERRHDGHQLAVVSHGGTLGVLLCHLLEIADPSRSAPFQLHNGSLSLLVRDRDRWRLVALNDVGHLDYDPLVDAGPGSRGAVRGPQHPSGHRSGLDPGSGLPARGGGV